MAKAVAKSFQARLEHNQSRLNWIIARIPFDVAQVWGSRGQLKVKGEINGYAFRTSLFPTGKGDHVLLVNKRMQAGARAGLGMTARFRLEPDPEQREIAPPGELLAALSEDHALRRWFDRLNYSTRKYVVDWVTDVKSAEARVRRSGQIAERLMATMEAERELPPIFRLAFARDPRALEGWKAMSATRRRGHLLGVFSYRQPAAQARRMAKAVTDARLAAERQGKRI